MSLRHDDIKFMVDLSLYNTDYKHYEECVKSIFENFEEHAGNLFYIIITNLDDLASETSGNNVNYIISHEFRFMYYLQSLIEATDETLGNFELVIKDKTPTDPKPPKIISNDSYLNRLFIKNLLKTYKVYFKDEFQRVNSSATNFIHHRRNIKPTGLLDMAELLMAAPLTTEENKKKTRKVMTKLIYDYLVNEAQPKSKGSSKLKIFKLVYNFLIIFNIID